MHLALRLICCVTPWAVAGLRFGRGPVRAYGVITRPLDDFSEAELRELFTDPRIDVSLGLVVADQETAFTPVVDELDLARLVQTIEAGLKRGDDARDTMQVLADHLALEAERLRDAAAPGGDDERIPEADPAASAAPPEAAAGGEGQDDTAADAPGASAVTPPAETSPAAAAKPAARSKK